MDNLKLIAIRVGDMGSDTSSIRKSLKSNTDYYLYQGYKISDNNIIEEREPTISIYNQPKAKFDSKDKFSYNHKPNERDFNINICAIVGENGCGKSALIEIMMRIINNFACYVIGEYRSSWAAENLLYVEGVRASLYYLGVTKGGDENGQLVDQEHSYKLDVYDRRVVLYRNGIELCNFENADLKYPIEPYARGISDLLGKNYHLYKTQIPILLQDFFYTIVSNYSVYAYNTNDVLNENADRDRISIINEVTKDKFFKNQLKLIEQIKFEIESIGSNDKIDPRIKKLAKQSLESKIKILEPRLEKDRSWLMGLFHKNDGYTAPMVITPFRDRGNMDVNNESFLAKSRLISLIASGIVKDINGKSIDRVELKWYEDKCFNSFEEVFSEVGLGEVTESANIELINTYSNEILNYYVQFGAIYDKTVLNNDDTGIQYALKYLVYKTLKISRNYTIFNRLYNTLLFNTNDDTEVKKAISDLVANIKADRSHITLKIRQIFSFLLRQQYDVSSYYIKHNESIEPDKVFFNDKVKLHISNNQDIDDLLPPAIFEVSIILSDKKKGEDILFNTLSSGERQFSYFTSSVVYHLRNLDSTGTACDIIDNGERVVYKSACLIFEEIELYFHPEMQRNLISGLIKMINGAELKHLRSIQMVFITHSPFILSDIPRKNCLFLKEGEMRYDEPNGAQMKTYGANIYDMLKSSFFLENGAMGEYAKKRIKKLIDKINYVYYTRKREIAIDKKQPTAMVDMYLEQLKYLERDYSNRRSIVKQISDDLRKNAKLEIEIIDEPIIKTKLSEMLDTLNLDE